MNWFGKFALIDDKALTNFTVVVFLIIVALRTIFSGADFHFHDFSWQVADLDISATLPLLFSLMNLGHARMTPPSSPERST